MTILTLIRLITCLLMVMGRGDYLSLYPSVSIGITREKGIEVSKEYTFPEMTIISLFFEHNLTILKIKKI